MNRESRSLPMLWWVVGLQWLALGLLAATSSLRAERVSEAFKAESGQASELVVGDPGSGPFVRISADGIWVEDGVNVARLSARELQTAYGDSMSAFVNAAGLHTENRQFGKSLRSAYGANDMFMGYFDSGDLQDGVSVSVQVGQFLVESRAAGQVVHRVSSGD